MSSQIKDKSNPVGPNLVAEMDRTGMTISVVAKALGVGERQVTRWRSGQEPRYQTVVDIAALFGRETEWFYVDRSEELGQAA